MNTLKTTQLFMLKRVTLGYINDISKTGIQKYICEWFHTSPIYGKLSAERKKCVKKHTKMSNSDNFEVVGLRGLFFNINFFNFLNN